jgi:hypothetical protein
VTISKVNVNGQDIIISPSNPIHIGPLVNVSIDVNVSNLGFSGSGGDFFLALFNGTRQGSMIDQPYQNLSVSALKAQGEPGYDSGSISAFWISSQNPGTYYVIIYADISFMSSESDENNNFWVLTFVISPDLVPNNITANGIPISSYTDETVIVLPGQSITIGMNISNVGSSSTGSIRD